MKKRIVAIALAGLFQFGAAYGLETQTQSMSFEACLATIRQVASDLAVAPVNIVETNILRVVRFVTVDGSVLVSCSRPDNKMIVTKSD